VFYIVDYFHSCILQFYVIIITDDYRKAIIKIRYSRPRDCWCGGRLESENGAPTGSRAELLVEVWGTKPFLKSCVPE